MIGISLLKVNLKFSRLMRISGRLSREFSSSSIKYISAYIGNSATAACEIVVHLNDEACTNLRVVDLIEFDDESKIRAIRAYKQ